MRQYHFLAIVLSFLLASPCSRMAPFAHKFLPPWNKKLHDSSTALVFCLIRSVFQTCIGHFFILHWQEQLLPGVEDREHVTVEHRLKLLFSLFSRSFSLFLFYCWTLSVPSTPSNSHGNTGNYSEVFSVLCEQTSLHQVLGLAFRKSQ